MYNEKEAIKAYVTGADHLQYTQLADGMIQVNVTHSNLKQYVMELRLDLHTPISEVKRKLLTHNGTTVEHMLLQLKEVPDGPVLRVLDDDARPLGYYSVANGQTIHVVDTDPFSLSRDGGLDDVSRIEKYRMSEEEYDKRGNTLRAYKRKMQAADPTFRLVPRDTAVTAAGGAPTLPVEAYCQEECVAGIAVGCRVEVAPGARRGTVGYVGHVAPLAAGYWVGVRLDEPLGKGDGSRGGIAFFECPDRYGAFVRPNFVSVGDFPEAGLEELLEASCAVADNGCAAEEAEPCGCAHHDSDAAQPAAPPSPTSPTSASTANGTSTPIEAPMPSSSSSGSSTATQHSSSGSSRAKTRPGAVCTGNTRRRVGSDSDDESDSEL